MPEDTSCWSQRRGGDGEYLRLWLLNTYTHLRRTRDCLHSRSVHARGRRRWEERACMHVRGGAEIPPEPQLTQTQKNIAAWQIYKALIQLWHDFIGFSVSILPEYRPLARSQEGRKTAILLFLCRTTRGKNIRDTCQSSAHQTHTP